LRKLGVQFESLRHWQPNAFDALAGLKNSSWRLFLDKFDCQRPSSPIKIKNCLSMIVTNRSIGSSTKQIVVIKQNSLVPITE